MKNSSFIIKIAVIVSAIASVFSIVTLIRAIIIKANIVLPIIQVVGSAAIFAVCFIMFRVLSKAGDGEDDEESDAEAEDDKDSEPIEKKSEKASRSSKNRRSRPQKDSKKKDVDAAEESSDHDQAEKEVDELYEKYHLSEFEKKQDEPDEK